MSMSLLVKIAVFICLWSSTFAYFYSQNNGNNDKLCFCQVSFVRGSAPSGSCPEAPGRGEIFFGLTEMSSCSWRELSMIAHAMWIPWIISTT